MTNWHSISITLPGPGIIFTGFFSVNNTTNLVTSFYETINGSTNFNNNIFANNNFNGADNLFINYSFTNGGTNINYMNYYSNPTSPTYNSQYTFFTFSLNPILGAFVSPLIGGSSAGDLTADFNIQSISDPSCFLETCNLMLTDGSYKNVKSIKTGDILRSALNGKDLRVLHCGHTVISDLSPVPTSNHPMCIPEGFFLKGSPSRDIFISGHHRVFFALNETTVGIQVFKLLPETNTLTMDKALEVVGSDVLKYYHVEVEGGKNAVFCDGLPVETLDVGEWSDSHVENQ